MATLRPRLVPAARPRRRAGWPAEVSAAVDRALDDGEARAPPGAGPRAPGGAPRGRGAGAHGAAAGAGFAHGGFAPPGTPDRAGGGAHQRGGGAHPTRRVRLEIVDCSRNGPATAVAWQSTGRLRSGGGRRHAAPGPLLTPQCPCAAMRPQSQVESHNFKVHPDATGKACQVTPNKAQYSCAVMEGSDRPRRGRHIWKPWGCSSVGRALESHSRGQGFDSPQLHSLNRTKERGFLSLSAF